MEDDDSKFEFSPFTGPVHHDGIEIQLRIYRFAAPGEQWQLEVIDQHGDTTTWEELFQTDGEAFEAFLEVMQAEGIRTFLGSPPVRH